MHVYALSQIMRQLREKLDKCHRYS